MIAIRALVGLGLGLLSWMSLDVHAKDVDWQARIAARNAAWTSAAATGDTASLLDRYADDATVMPEHARVRRGRAAVSDFYRQWWAQARPARWERTTESIDDAGLHLIELGRYAQTLAREGRPAFEYTGKYLVVWRKSEDGLRAVAELWGANAPFERDQLPEIAASGTMPSPVSNASDEAVRALAERNALIATLVRERRGADHALLFRDDAAYLTYYTPPLRGIAPIRAYFVEHERPGPVSIDSIELRSDGVRTLDSGDLQLEEGSYRVGWRAGGDSGVVEGKSLNIWRRGKDGVWMLYRQAVNHD